MNRYILFLLVIAAQAFTPAFAQTDFPNKPVRLVVPYPPGGLSDTTARLLAEQMTNILSQPVVVENRPGANGSIGAASLARAEPDGYTIGYVAASHVFNGALLPNLSFDPVEDFSGVSLVTLSPMVMVVPATLPVQNVPEFVQYVKENSGAINYGSAGTGSNMHFFGAWFNDIAKLDMTHVPYKGSGPAHMDLIAGRTHMLFDTYGALRSHIDSGRMKVIGSGSGTFPRHPNVKEISDQGFPGFSASSWGAVIAPANVPTKILTKLSSAIREAANVPSVRQALEAGGVKVVASEPSELDTLLAEEARHYSVLIKQLGITLN